MVPGINLWVRGKKKARIQFATIADDQTPYGPLVFPQDLHERLLIDRLEKLGVSVERSTELVSYREGADGLTATLKRSDGTEESCSAGYLAGCDGARSAVRQGMGAGFPGGTYQQVFYVADIDAAGPALDGELHVDLDAADFLAVFPLKGEGRARLIGTVRDERAAHPETLKFEDVSDRAIKNMNLQVGSVNWFSTYRVHHRVTERFRQGRVFLLGDAAHIHSPAGGQGMNTGIGDAINLAWKLKSVLARGAADALLDTYESERRAFALKLVSTTDKAFSLATADGKAAAFIRTRIVPLVIPALFKLPAARKYMFRAVSQILISYRASAISSGRAGSLMGGDRLPWAPATGSDNFDTCKPISWQVHVYGTAAQPLRDWCRSVGLILHAFPWQRSYARAGLICDAMYLLRPDMYIALAAAAQKPEALRAYFAGHGISKWPAF
jgi:2-polyprenyl-6-methoxyphenol hydroxylase-like FAD-dependent oxidoreductase